MNSTWPIECAAAALGMRPPHAAVPRPVRVALSWGAPRDVVRDEVAQASRVALEEAPSNTRLAAVEDSVGDDVKSQGLRVLVADDEPINREALAQHLTARGFDVVHAQDGVQAIERIETDTPDVVLLDAMMPRKTG